MKIQKELDETKIVLHKTIESVLERGEKIDSLVEKSDGLSAQSKMFYSKRRKHYGMLNVGLTFSFYRTGKAAKLLLYNHVEFRTAHSVAEKPPLRSVYFGTLVTSLMLGEKTCRPSAAWHALSSTSLPGAPSSIVALWRRYVYRRLISSFTKTRHDSQSIKAKNKMFTIFDTVFVMSFKFLVPATASLISQHWTTIIDSKSSHVKAQCNPIAYSILSL